MAIVDVKVMAGTIAEPQNTQSNEAAWQSTSQVHFPDDKMTPIPAYEESVGASGSLALQGTCRAQWAGRLGGSSTIAGAYYLFGTHSHLFAEYKAVRYNITPFADQKSELLGNNPLDVHSGSATMDINWTAHGLTVGDEITLAGSTTVDAVDATTYINISHRVVTVVNANKISITLGTTAGSTTSGGGANVTATAIGRAAVLGANPISVTNLSPTVTVTYTAHGMAVGDRFKLNFATAVGGITTAMLNKEHIVASVSDANTITFTASGNASSTTTGGGSVVSIFKQIAAGNQNQTFLSGYGAGTYGSGLYDVNRFSTTAQSYPRIWSFDNFGNQFIMCAGDYSAGDGQKLYIWDGDRDVAPQILDGGLFPNAPTDCNWVAVVANQIVALCGTNIVIALTDPSTGGATFPTVPSTTAFGDVIPVQRSTRLLSIAPFGEKSAIVFAPEPMLLRLVGGVWDLVELGNDYPIVAPSAFCKINDGIMWYAQDGNYYFCNGGAVQPVINRMNGEYVRERTNQNAIWTSFMMADQKHGQAWHYYPSTGQSNPDSYVIFNPANKSFTTGAQNRTSAQRPSVIDQRFYMTNDDTVYAAFLQGSTTFSWSARTAFFFIEPNYRFKVTRLYPDTVVTGSVSVTIYGREHPQDDDINYGTYTLDADSTAITVRAASRLMALEFSGTTDFTLAGLKMEVQKMGTRRL